MSQQTTTTAETQSALQSVESKSEAGSEISSVLSQNTQLEEEEAKQNPLQMRKNKNKPKLMIQSLVKLNINELTPLSPQVISSQATINIGTIGHVAHGKTTVVQALSGKRTIQFTMEKIRNITIKLGYANAKIYKCNSPDHQAPSCYRSFKSQCQDILNCDKPGCNGKLLLKRQKNDDAMKCFIRHVSFVDCPGHDILMSTMLTGAAIMDAALLLIAANQTCPQPQTSQHLAAVQIMQLNNIIILQNKIDIILRDSSAAKKQHQDIKKFIQNTKAQKAPIIPISAQLRYNIDVICEYLCRIPIPIRDFTSSPRMIIIRSFDVNKPGEEIDNLKGGVAGGSILRGVLKIGDQVQIRPGVIGKNQDGSIKCQPIYSKVISLRAQENDLQFAVPGGLIAVGLGVDPTLTRANRLVGMVMGYPGQLPDVIQQIDISYYLLRRLLGVKSEGGKGKKMEKVSKIKKGQVLLVNIGSNTSGGKVTNVKTEYASLSLLTPVCASIGEKVALSRNIDKNWRLIGWGEIKSAIKI